MRQHIYLDHQAIEAMTRKREILNNFPFFSKTIFKKDCCGKNSKNVVDFDFILLAIKGMSKEDQKKLKDILNVSSLSFFLNSSEITI